MELVSIERNEWLFFITFTILVSCLEKEMMKVCLKQQGREKEIPNILLIQVLVTVLFLWLYGNSKQAYQSICFCHLLNIIAVWDFKTHQVPNIFSILLAMTGLIVFEPSVAFMGLSFVPIPFFLAAMRGKIGGGDVKLMMASGFVLGVSHVIFMIITGLLAGIVWNQLFYKQEKIPLVPCLAVGGFLAMFPLS